MGTEISTLCSGCLPCHICVQLIIHYHYMVLCIKGYIGIMFNTDCRSSPCNDGNTCIQKNAVCPCHCGLQQ